jgi:type II secretory pathway pseudopilin PulG
VRLALKGTDLCMEGAELEVPVCLRPRRGLLLLGAPSALDRVESTTRAAPAASAVTEASATPVASPVPLLVGFRVDMGKQGRASLALTGRDAVRLTGRAEGLDPRAVGSIDRVVKKLLQDYDTREQQKRQRIGTALSEVQAALAQDTTAPAELKESARTLTVEQVVDEKGYWAKMRQTLETTPSQDGYTVSLTVPEGLVKDIAEQLTGGGAMTAGTLGVLAAVAVPNFVKFQSRAKQTEVKSNLKAAYTAQRVFAAEKKRWGKSFREIGFAPESGRRYTYCLGTECLPCDRAECTVAADHSPCKGITRVGRKLPDGFAVCAYGNVDTDPDVDVWVIDQGGEPLQLNADER